MRAGYILQGQSARSRHEERNKSTSKVKKKGRQNQLRGQKKGRNKKKVLTVLARYFFGKRFVRFRDILKRNRSFH